MAVYLCRQKQCKGSSSHHKELKKPFNPFRQINNRQKLLKTKSNKYWNTRSTLDKQNCFKFQNDSFDFFFVPRIEQNPFTTKTCWRMADLDRSVKFEKRLNYSECKKNWFSKVLNSCHLVRICSYADFCEV